MNEPQIVDVENLDGTAMLARRLAARLPAGTCLTLEGDLGAGKTTFVRALVDAMGGDPRQVSSPTYVLLHVYQAGATRVNHLDAYRLHGSDELEAIGFDELLRGGGLTIVEWASRVAEALPPPGAGRLDVSIETTGPDARRFTFVGAMLGPIT